MHLSFVLLEAAEALAAETIAAAFRDLFPGIAVAASQTDGNTVEVQVGAYGSLVALIAAPVPAREADAASLFSLAAFSPEGGAPAPHHAHLVVTSPGDGLQSLVAHTRVVAACARARRAVAVYEGNGRATHPTEFYVDVVTASERPILVWTGISVAEEMVGRVSILTLGIRRTLGLPDLLVTGPPTGRNTALAFLFDLLDHVVARGTPLAAGDTVGRSAEERIAVVYEESPLDPGVEVARIDLP